MRSGARVFDVVQNQKKPMMEDMAGFDMETRDPNNLNRHLQVMWDDVIGEPEGIRSGDCTWRTSYKCFRGTKNCCYTLLSCLLGPIVACCLGCQFACLAFQNIWCSTPCLRQCKINCNFVRSINTICNAAFFAPCYDVCGMVFQRIRVRHGGISREDARDEDPLVV